MNESSKHCDDFEPRSYYQQVVSFLVEEEEKIKSAKESVLKKNANNKA